jgi:hypothetical protein
VRLTEAAVAAVLAEHELLEHSARNGYTEPQEHWATCECGAFLGDWQQYYHETDYDPERDFRAHLASVIVAIVEADDYDY